MSKVYGDRMADRRIRQLVADSKLSGFDPEKSAREKRKLKRKIYSECHQPQRGPSSMFDEKGRYRSSGLDVCDCLDNTCPGCHFPCPNCKSTKCGTVCRVNRKWPFDSIEHDGKDLVIRNKFLDK